MSDFHVTTSGLTLRPARPSDVPVFSCEPGELQTFEYMNYSRGPRRAGSRAATTASAASLLLDASVALNQRALTVGLRNWLRTNARDISTRLVEADHSVFIVQYNYISARGPMSTVYMSRDIHILGTVKDLSEVRTILTPRVLNGPHVDAQPRNALQRFEYAYLIGQREGANNILPSSLTPRPNAPATLSLLRK